MSDTLYYILLFIILGDKFNISYESEDVDNYIVKNLTNNHKMY